MRRRAKRAGGKFRGFVIKYKGYPSKIRRRAKRAAANLGFLIQNTKEFLVKVQPRNADSGSCMTTM